MLKVFADFNARTKDDACFALHYRGVVLEKQIEDLRLSKGIKLCCTRTKTILR
jgi:hypothetical protein